MIAFASGRGLSVSTTYVAFAAGLGAGCVATIVYQLSTAGLVICIGLNFGARQIFRRRADIHEKRYHGTM